jgi:hypothetical protein
VDRLHLATVETMTTIQITDFTDPVCPFAWSAEPSRLRIEWLYGDQIELRPRMVGLSESAEAMAARGLTPELLARGAAMLAAAHHMPIDTAPRPRLGASIPGLPRGGRRAPERAGEGAGDAPRPADRDLRR